MERELWKSLYDLARLLDNTTGDQFYLNWEIAVVYLWAVVHDRPTVWACDLANWPSEGVVCRLPCQSTVSRRLRNEDVIDLLAAMESQLSVDVQDRLVWSIDGKPLPIGAHSKDPDAKLGFSGNGFSKGYKLHAIWGETPTPSSWCVESMNVGEAKVARRLVEQHHAKGYLLGDRQYDSNPLHEVTSKKEIQLVAPQKRKGKLGSRKHSASRIHALNLLEKEFGKALYKMRWAIEQAFGNLTSFGAGLGPLPSWVRRRHRVHLWVQAKILINAARITYNQNSKLPAHA